MVLPKFDLGFTSKKKKFTENVNTSTKENSAGAGQFRGSKGVTTPQGWVANYNALGKGLGFGAVTQRPPAVQRPLTVPGGQTQSQGPNAFGGYQTDMPSFNPQEFQPSNSWMPPGQQGQQQGQQQGAEVGSEPYANDETFTGAAGGPTGYNAQQQQGVDILTKRTQPGGNVAIGAIEDGRTRVGQSHRALDKFWDDELNPALQADAHQLGAGPEDVGDISAQEGWRGRDNYMNPYQKEVIDATGADLEEDDARLRNRLKMSAQAGGAFGGRGEAVQGAIAADDYGRRRNSILGGLRSQGWKDSNSFSMMDADRSLSAAQSNQTTQTANADRRNSRDMANLESKIKSDEGKRQIMQLASDNAIAAGELGIAGAELGIAQSDQERTGAMDLFEAGQIGFDQLMAFLGIGQGMFGETEEGDESEIGSSSGTGTKDTKSKGSETGFSGGISGGGP